jgi:disulfide bond formation protein DsbB
MTNSSPTENAWRWVFLAWVLSLIATLGSLFFSEVMRYPPCVLCWYQRIGMYPLVGLFLIGLFPVSKEVLRFTFPLSVGGWLVASYHNLLYYKILPQSAAPCAQGISCTSVHIQWLGFITIPLLSFTAFSLILLCQFMAKRKFHHEK